MLEEIISTLALFHRKFLFSTHRSSRLARIFFLVITVATISRLFPIHDNGMDSGNLYSFDESQSRNHPLPDWTHLPDTGVQDSDSSSLTEDSSCGMFGMALCYDYGTRADSSDLNTWETHNIYTPSHSSHEDTDVAGDTLNDMINDEAYPACNTKDLSELQGSLRNAQSLVDLPELISIVHHHQLSLEEATFETLYVAADAATRNVNMHRDNDAILSEMNDTTTDVFNEPWNPTGLRQQHFESGFVAYLDESPVTSGEFQLEIPHTDDHILSSLTYQRPISEEMQDPIEMTSMNESEGSWTWVNDTSSHKQDPSASSNKIPGGPRRGGGRAGPLHPQRREQACEMRKIKACMFCWLRKVKCSPGPVCEECSKRQYLSSLMANRPSCRSVFGDYAVLFFPNFLTSHLAQREVEDLISANSKGFSDQRFAVDVCTGQPFKPMRLTVNVFEPRGKYLCFQEYLANGSSGLVCRYSAPVGLLGVDNQELELTCAEYINSMVLSPSYAQQVTEGDRSTLCQDILKLVLRYNHEENDVLLSQALKLHAMHDSMTKVVTFTPKSASALSARVFNIFAEQYEPYISSKLLNRQVKVAFHRLLKDAQSNSLKGLWRQLRTRDRNAWPCAFSVFLVLCLCAEGIQIAVDNFVTYKEPGTEGHRKDSHKICVELETLLYGQGAQLFHEVYGTFKIPNGHGSDGSFNPFKQTQLAGTDFSRPAQELISGMKNVIDKHYEEMVEMTEQSVFDRNGFNVTNETFVEQNPGRLASKFLLSFMNPNFRTQ